jgi:hypothetical protein
MASGSPPGSIGGRLTLHASPSDPAKPPARRMKLSKLGRRVVTTLAFPGLTPQLVGRHWTARHPHQT